MPTTTNTGDPFNTQQVPPNTLPYMQRFAGGALGQRTFTPYAGDPTQYGFGAQHRYYVPDTTSWSTSTATNTDTSNPQALSVNDWMDRDPGWRMANPQLAPKGYEKNFNRLGIGNQGGDTGRSDGGWSGGAGASGGWDGGAGGGGGALAKGGPVKGDNVHGQDDVSIMADGGEYVIKADSARKIGNSILEKLNRGEYHLPTLKQAVGMKGGVGKGVGKRLGDKPQLDVHANNRGENSYRAYGPRHYAEGGPIEAGPPPAAPPPGMPPHPPMPMHGGAPMPPPGPPQGMPPMGPQGGPPGAPPGQPGPQQIDPLRVMQALKALCGLMSGGGGAPEGST